MFLLGQEIISYLEDNTSVCDEDAGNLVKRSYLVHSSQIDDDLVEDRNRASNETGVSALGYNSELVSIAVL